MRVYCILNQSLNSPLELKLTKEMGDVIAWESTVFSTIFVLWFVLGFLEGFWGVFFGWCFFCVVVFFFFL